MKASEAAKISNEIQWKDDSEPIFKMIKRAAEQGKRSITIPGGISFGTAKRLESENYSVYTHRSYYWGSWCGETRASKSKFETIISW